MRPFPAEVHPVVRGRHAVRAGHDAQCHELEKRNSFVLVKNAGFCQRSGCIPTIVLSVSGGVSPLRIEADGLRVVEGTGSEPATLEQIEQIALSSSMACEHAFSAMLFVSDSPTGWNVGDA